MTIAQKIQDVLVKHGILHLSEISTRDNGVYVLRTPSPVFPIVLIELAQASGEVWEQERFSAPVETPSVKTELNVGMKHDAEKIQLELLSPSWLIGVGKVLTFGARKYAAHNWRKGIERSRLLGAALRHIFAYLGGEDYDSETGLLHLYHATCCLMFASELHYTRKDLDDRYKVSQSEYRVPELKTEIKETVFKPDLQKVAGEWIVVNVDGKDVAAFVPSAVTGKILPTEIYVSGGAA